jgi:hypothetical protein
MAFFNVVHPVKNLTVTVRFPDAFNEGLTLSDFVIRVTKLEPDLRSLGEPDDQLSQQLQAADVLRYTKALSTATLRVEHPMVGYAYALSWRVLCPKPRTSCQFSQGAEQEIRNILSEIDRQRKPNKVWKRSMKAFLQTAAKLLLDELMPTWQGDLELSLMVFRESTRCLEDVAAIQVRNAKLVESSDMVEMKSYGASLGYGAGVAGKAYKTNEARLWVKIPPDEKTSPDYYIPVSGTPNHAVLLSMPIQNYEDELSAYAIMNCGSASALCPLSRFGESDQDKQKLLNVQKSLNRLGFDLLSDAVDKQRVATEEYGAEGD